MPAGYSSRCRVCNSPHRTEVEKWCKEEGLRSRGASARLLSEYGEKISHQSIWKHLDEHFDIRTEVKEKREKRHRDLNVVQEQLKKSEEQLQRAVHKGLSDIEMLESTIASNFDLSQATTAWLADLVEQKSKIPLTLVQLREKLQSEMRQAMRTKAEFLGDDPQSRLVDVFQGMWGDADDTDADTEE